MQKIGDENKEFFQINRLVIFARKLVQPFKSYLTLKAKKEISNIQKGQRSQFPVHNQWTVALLCTQMHEPGQHYKKYDTRGSFYKEFDQNFLKTCQIYIKMDQNCILKHTINAWSIFLFAFLISQFKLKVIVSCTWVFHLFSHQIWPKTGQNWIKMSDCFIMQCLFFWNFGTITVG